MLTYGGYGASTVVEIEMFIVQCCWDTFLKLDILQQIASHKSLFVRKYRVFHKALEMSVPDPKCQ